MALQTSLGKSVAEVSDSRSSGEQLSTNKEEGKTGWVIFSDFYTTRDQRWAVIGGIGCGAVLGVLIRDRLCIWFAAALAEPGAAGRAGVLVKHILPNMVGCFVMGAVVAMRPRLQPPHPTIYAGLTTGFCGCCTTFSSYNTDVALLFLKSANAGDGIMCAAMALFLGAATAWVCLMLGLLVVPQPRSRLAELTHDAHQKLNGILSSQNKREEDIKALVSDLMAAAEKLELAAPDLAYEVPQLPGKLIRLKVVVYWSLLLLGLASAIISIDIDNVSPLVLAMTLGPPGAWLRYRLGMWNAKYSLPYFTFFANLLAAGISALLAYFTSCGRHDLEDSRWVPVLTGVSTGFCGSLSTVSSFVDEVRRLGAADTCKSSLYVAMTLVGGQMMALLILAPAFANTRECNVW